MAWLVLPIWLQNPVPEFDRDVRPILEQSCHECHGPSRQKGGLRLDQKAAAFAGSSFGREPVLVPNDLDASTLWWMVSDPSDPDRMPPADKKPPLSPEQVDILRRWIEGGAPWPDDGEAPSWPSRHWAYSPPDRPEIPEVEDASWCRNPVDRFILARLEEKELKPSPTADPPTLARRSSLYLTGLPPPPESLGIFLESTAAKAWTTWVASLFGSPHYGEQQALRWLDLARYADSNGYEVDQDRSIWPWRDWVIDAFNAGMPFDQFTREQLAGDLIPDATDAQRVATGFHRNSMTNTEGGVDPEEYRVEAVLDRVNTTATVWMGATMACVQCHDHKYDPFSVEDYYGMFAIFNDTADGGSTTGPTLQTLTARQQVVVDLLQGELEDRRQVLSAAESAHQDSTPPPPKVWVDETHDPDGERLETWNEVKTVAHTGSSSREQKGEETVQHHFSHAKHPFVVEADTLLWAWVLLDPESPPRQVMLQFHAENWEHRAFWGEDLIPWGTAGTPSRKSLGELPETGGWVRLEVPSEEVGLAAGDEVHGMAFSQYGGLAWWDEAGFTPPHSEIAAARAALREVEGRIPKPASTLVMQQVTEPRETRILERGSFLSPGETVEPGAPWVLDRRTRRNPTNRLEFAAWLCDSKNPLTARVVVNRLWEDAFGTGLVATSDDFGTRGEAPSHPKLLDWLAVEFVDSGWNLQHIQSLILDSATFRQDSKINPEATAIDPSNRLLASFPRIRLAAETLRDQALSLAGLLNPTIGGPSVKPPQPAGIDLATYAGDRWRTSMGPDRHRRGMYTFWRRTSPYPTFVLFDAPSRELTCSRRDRSNSPLQALALLNDPVFVEAAEALGRAMAGNKAAVDRDRLEWGFRLCTARTPTSKELNILHDLLKSDGWSSVGRVLLNLDEVMVRG